MAVADNSYISTGADMVSVANKIREKAGVSNGLVFPDGWIEAIEGIKTGSGGITPSGNKAITATTSTQTGIDVTNYATVSVAPTPSETKSVTTNGDVTPSSGKLLSKVIVNVPTGTARDSSDLTVSGAIVNVPAGLYSSAASKSVASGTAGTPTASKGAVSNNSVTVTPSVTNTTGYITGGTKTGTGVKVSASELVSGNKAITPSETAQSGIDVTNFKTASVGAISSAYVGSGVTRKAAATITPTESEQVISAGQYLEGDQTISAIPSNYIGSGIATKGSTTITPSTSIQTAVSAGTYVTGDIKVSAMPTGKLSTPTINTNTGVVTSGVATAGYLDSSAAKTLQLTTKSAATITPSTANQTIAAGQYLIGIQTIQGDSNLIPENIASGVSIFGVTGTHKSSSGIDTSDATATKDKILKDYTAYINNQKITGTLDYFPRTNSHGGHIGGANYKPDSVIMEDGCVMLDYTVQYPQAFLKDSHIGMKTPLANFGDAAKSDVISGKTFTSGSGLKESGTLVIQKYYTGTSEPSSSLGNDGDIYLKA